MALWSICRRSLWPPLAAPLSIEYFHIVGATEILLTPEGEPVRAALSLFLLALLWPLAGCTISRRIVDIQPMPQPRLENLERHLTYRDPDDGRQDYIILRR